MDNNNEIARRLRDKANRLIVLYEQEVANGKQLEEKYNSVAARLFEQEKKISELENRIQKLQLAGAFKSTSTDTQAAKAKIGKIVREIDKCVALLNK